MSAPASILELHEVTKVYGEGATTVRALDGIDLVVGTGELVAVMGPSGSGKSTLLTIAGTLEEASSGTVTIDGVAVAGLSRNARAGLRRRSIGYVFQDFNLLAGLTAAENVALPLELDGTGARAARATGLAALDELGLAERAGRYPDELSGGERQRVRDRPRGGGRAPAAAGRRAHRRARLGERRDRHAPAARGLPARRGRRDRHPRRPAGGVGRPGGLPPRRACGRPHLPRARARVAPHTGRSAVTVASGSSPPGSTPALLDRPPAGGNGNGAGQGRGWERTGGVAARRVVVRWAWRLFRREWRQQLLVLVMLTLAVAVASGGTAALYSTAPIEDGALGIAQQRIDLGGNAPTEPGAGAGNPSVAETIASAEDTFGTVEAIGLSTVAVPGSVTRVELRAQDPEGPYGSADARHPRRSLPARRGRARGHRGRGRPPRRDDR